MKNGRISKGGLPLVLFGLLPLMASAPAGAHGAPDAEGAPSEIVQARITKQPNIQGLNAMILDAPRPGILLSYRGDTPLTVLGTQDEAFSEIYWQDRYGQYGQSELAGSTKRPCSLGNAQ